MQGVPAALTVGLFLSDFYVVGWGKKERKKKGSAVLIYTLHVKH